MERTFPKIAGLHFIQGKPCIVKHLLIQKDCSSAGVQYHDVLRNQIYDSPQLLFVLPKLKLTGLERFFRLFTLGDVCPGHIPSNDSSLLIQQRVVDDEEPAIDAVLPQCPLLILEWDGMCERLPALLAQPFQVFGVDYSISKVIAAHFVERQSRVLTHHTVGVNHFSFCVQDEDRLWNKIYDSPQLLFILRELWRAMLEIGETLPFLRGPAVRFLAAMLHSERVWVCHSWALLSPL